jgi:apolipoprotein N-acyltransferase
VRLTSLGPPVSTVAADPRPTARRPLAAWQAIALAAVGGLALTAAFPPIGIWPLAAAGPALLTIALWRQRLRTALAVGVVFGLTFYFPLLSWVVNVLWMAYLALAIAASLLFAALAVGQWLLLRLRAWPLAVSGWWVAAEAVRSRWPFGGFPWGRLVMSQAESPLLRWVGIGGPAFVTFLLALVGACVAWLILGSAESPATANGNRSRARQRVLAAAATVLAAALALSGPLLPASQGAASAPTAEIAAIQGNVPHATNLNDLWRATTVTQYHADATSELAARVRRGLLPAPDLVIWPENSTDQDPSLNPPIYDTILNAVDLIDRPILVGAVLQNPVRNSGQLWLPGKGPVAIYVKRKLVPFGEVIPFRSLISKITSLPSTLQPVNFTPGHKAVVFRIGKIRLGDVICYEVGFDGLVYSEVAGGANLLSVQTNDADFELDGQTSETLQQLDMARIRAVEFDRAVVVASTTGVSAIIAPDGSTLVSTKTWTRAEIEARVPLLTTQTLAYRLGGWPEGLLSWATVAAVVWAIGLAFRQRRRRHEPTPAPSAAGEPPAAD